MANGLEVDMNTLLCANILRWVARCFGVVMVGLTLTVAIGEGLPNVFHQPLAIQLGFLGLAMLLTGMLLAWRWERWGGFLSLAGWVLFIVAVKINVRHMGFLGLLGMPGLLFLGSSYLRRKVGKQGVA